MPIDVITGQPGNGKSLRMMQRLVAESAKTGADRRFLVAVGIDGIQPGLVDLVLADGKDWNEIDPNGEPVCDCGAGRKLPDGNHEKHAHFIPDGALFFVDEAWKWFGHLHDASRAPTPPHVLMLAEHRHRGFDMVWTTQMVNQVYPFVRGLIGTHSHVARRFGTRICTVFQWGELCEDVKSATQREKALSETWVHPSNMFDKYKSATVHTIKPRLPWKLFLIPICLIGALVLGYFGYESMKPDNFAATLNGEPEPGSGEAAPAPASEDSPKLPTTAKAWAEYLAPTVPGLAFTAPVFAENLEVTTHPMTLCYLVGEGPESRCKCVTEQATPLDVGEPMCRSIVKGGIYDPFKPEREPVREATVQTVVTPSVLPKEAERLDSAVGHPPETAVPGGPAIQVTTDRASAPQ